MEWNEFKKSLDAISEEEMVTVRLVYELINRRKDLGFSQRELARRANMKQSTIARMESLITSPTLDTINKITNVLGMKIELKLK